MQPNSTIKTPLVPKDYFCEDCEHPEKSFRAEDMKAKMLEDAQQ